MSGGRTLATHVAEIIGDAPADSLTALEAAQRIRAWRDTVQTLSALAEAQVMEATWAIRREHPNRAAFDAFVVRELDGALESDRAWSMADTWDAARRNRTLRDLVRRRPEEAITFVRDYAEATEHAGFGEDDREAAQLLAAPPRKRRAMLRELQAAARAGRKRRDPNDATVSRDPERDATATRVRTAARDGSPIEGLAEDARRLAHRADEFDALRGRLSGSARHRLLRLADMAMRSVEQIKSALQEERTP